MPARRRTTPNPAGRRPRVAGTTPAARPEGAEPEMAAIAGSRTRSAVPESRLTRHRLRPAAEETDRDERPAVADGPVDGDAAVPRPADPHPADPHPADAVTDADPVTDAESVTDDVGGSDDPAAAAGDATPGQPEAGVGAVTGGGRPVPTGRTERVRLRKAPASAPAGPGPAARLRTVPVLAAALAVLVALAAFLGIATASLRGAPAAANTALTDLAATAEVQSQLTDALEALYSYDFARLDENERAAREVITAGFTPEFERLFAQVRELAPQQQAVVSAVVAVSAVQEIRGDRAVLVAFMDQQATTVANAEQVAAAGRLTVTGERVDGRWKIAAVESR